MNLAKHEKWGVTGGLKPPPPSNIKRLILSSRLILLCTSYYFAHSIFSFTMASNDRDPFVVDVVEARQHDELVVEHFFEGNSDNEDSDVFHYSTNDEVDQCDELGAEGPEPVAVPNAGAQVAELVAILGGFDVAKCVSVPNGGAEVVEPVAAPDGAEVGDAVDRTKRNMEMKRHVHRGKVGKISLGKAVRYDPHVGIKCRVLQLFRTSDDFEDPASSVGYGKQEAHASK